MSHHDFPTLLARNRALFLDLDGVIKVNHGYVQRPENFDITDGIYNIVTKPNFKLVVITKQAAIPSGYYLKSNFYEFSIGCLINSQCKACL